MCSCRSSDEDNKTAFRFCYEPLSGPKMAKHCTASGWADKVWNGPVVLST